MVISVTSVTSIAAQINSLPSDLLPLEQIVKAVSRHRGVHLMVGSGSSSGKISWKKNQTLGFSNKVMGWGFDGIYLHIYICYLFACIWYSIYIANTCQYYVTMRLRWVYQENGGGEFVPTSVYSNGENEVSDPFDGVSWNFILGWQGDISQTIGSCPTSGCRNRHDFPPGLEAHSGIELSELES